MGKARIFVANDDKELLDLMKELLGEEGYSVETLKSAGNAYDEIVEYLPDLLILDMRLDGEDSGWLVLEKVKLNPKTTDMPVIICSAAAQDLRDSAARLEEMGCLVIEKPFDIDDLLAAVSQALRSQPPKAE
jgi:DNA-binding response OmpR family regulator